MTNISVLLVEDDKSFSRMVAAALAEVATVTEALDVSSAIESLAGQEYNVVITDLRLGQGEKDANGLDLLRHVQIERPGLPVIVMTAYGDESVSVRAMRGGAYYYLPKPTDPQQLRELVYEASRSRIRPASKGVLTYVSPEIGEVLRMVRSAGEDGNLSVLLTGETGTGKEVLATELHRSGRRCKAPFVALSLVGSSPQLIESDIFGHERGAFTGAVSRRLGCLEKADRGVLFLDEIDSLPLDAQAKLLRVLETREFVRLGGQDPIRVDFQLVAATRQDLPRLVQAGLFRDDLYFRIAVLDLRIPPLRLWGTGDIEKLAGEFLAGFVTEGRTNAKGLSQNALAALKRYSWPGNVRELRNVLSVAILHYRARGERGDILDVDLPRAIADAADLTSTECKILPQFAPEGFDLRKALEIVEVHYIQTALEHFNGAVGKASMLLYGNRSHLTRRLQILRPGKAPEQTGAASDDRVRSDKETA